MSNTRYFVVEPDRVFIPPKGLLSAPGRTARTFTAGELVELRPDQVTRFVRVRRDAGDVREVSQAEAERLKVVASATGEPVAAVAATAAALVDAVVPAAVPARLVAPVKEG
jgi:hypothetical protein